MKTKQMMSQRKAIEVSIEAYLRQYPDEFDGGTSHLENLEARLTNLLIGLQSLKMDDDRLRKEDFKAASLQR